MKSNTNNSNAHKALSRIISTLESVVSDTRAPTIVASSVKEVLETTVIRIDAARSHVTALEKRIEELEAICGQAYQVVANFADRLPDTKMLDNLAQAKLIHTDILPFVACAYYSPPGTDRAIELLERIEIQCKAVGHPVGGIDELKHYCRQHIVVSNRVQGLINAVAPFLDVAMRNRADMERIGLRESTKVSCQETPEARAESKRRQEEQRPDLNGVVKFDTLNIVYTFDSLDNGNWLDLINGVNALFETRAFPLPADRPVDHGYWAAPSESPATDSPKTPAPTAIEPSDS